MALHNSAKKLFVPKFLHAMTNALTNYWELLIAQDRHFQLVSRRSVLQGVAAGIKARHVHTLLNVMLSTIYAL